MTLKIGYKIVRRRWGQLWSMSVARGFGEVLYSLHHWTYPKAGCGPLVLFEDLRSAYQHVKKFEFPDDYLLFECLYEPSSATKVWTNPSYEEELCYMPPGAVLAKCIKLTALRSDVRSIKQDGNGR